MGQERRERHISNYRASLATDECLDWQTSQFIDIVGKDDVSRAGVQKRVFRTEVACYLLGQGVCVGSIRSTDMK